MINILDREYSSAGRIVTPRERRRDFKPKPMSSGLGVPRMVPVATRF